VTDRSKQLTFVADGETLDTIDMLKKELGAPTAAAVFRKALVIAKLAAEQGRGSNGIVKFRGRNQPPAEEIAVALKA
jgi:hypothetical protein